MGIILDLVMAFVVGSLAIFGLSRLWMYIEAVPTGQDRTDFFDTRRGRRLAIHRYAPLNSPDGDPVILCHGIACNRYIFDLNPAPSLAEFLRSRGHDVWVAELEGSGLSSKPGIFRSDCEMGWGFDDHLEDNMDAIISHVTSQTGRTSAHWIGHSMGGMLIEAYLARNNSHAVSSAIAIASPVDFSRINTNSLKLGLRFGKVLRLIPFNPLIPVMKCLMPVGKMSPRALSVFFSMDNIEWSVARKLVAVGVEFLSSSVLWLDMARFMDEGKFQDRAGRSYLDGIDQSKTPILVLAGTKDNMAPKDSVMAVTNCRTENQVTECVVFGKESGCLEEYGHTDLLIGKRVEKEVFPVIHNWLERCEEREKNRNYSKLM